MIQYLNNTLSKGKDLFKIAGLSLLIAGCSKDEVHVSGTVTKFPSGEVPQRAIVLFDDNARVVSVYADSLTGRYDMTVPKGSWNARVISQGNITVMYEVNLKDDTVLKLTVVDPRHYQEMREQMNRNNK